MYFSFLTTETYRALTLNTQPATSSTHPTKMRLYYVVSGILLILSIIDFAVAAPVLLQENPQAVVDIVKIPEDAMTALRKRVGDWEKVWQLEILRRPKSQYYSKLWESSRPQLPAPPGGWTDVSQPLPSIPEEPSTPFMSKISKFLMSKLAK
jgi:hypothetical protein